MLMCGIGYLYAIDYAMVPIIFPRYWKETCFIAILLVVPIIKPFILNSKRNRVLECVGKASFNIYLVQMIWFKGSDIIYCYIPNRGTQIGISLIICTLVGFLFYAIETPITKRIKRAGMSLLDKHTKAIRKKECVVK